MKVHIGNPVNNSGDRKISIDVNEDDVWNMDTQLAMIIFPMLLQLKGSQIAIPAQFAEDIGGEDYVEQQSFDFYYNSYSDAFSENAKKWDETLDKMIWSFQQIAYCDYYSKYHHRPEQGKTNMNDNSVNNWYDLVGHNEHERRIQEGINLFAQYYRALWF